MEMLQMNNGPIYKYNDLTSQMVIDKISNYKADLGGTNILAPLEKAITQLPNQDLNGKAYRKRIFLLTDGQVNNRDDCVVRCMTAVDVAKIHIFGIGNEID